MKKITYKTVDLFGNEQLHIIQKKNDKENLFTQYDKFIDKFETPKTTDDCYTPDDVYKIILDYVAEKIDLSNLQIIRPFYPDGDYESIDYKKNDIVIDNPPFSIISKIAKFYISKKIKFFLFAPHLTLFQGNLDCTYLIVGGNIIYENKAVVKTSFITNILSDYQIIGEPILYKKFKQLNDSNKINLPKYKYPQNVLTVSQISWFVERGISITLNKNQCYFYRTLDDQRKQKKLIFCAGFLISEKAAAEKAAAEKAAAEKAAAEKENIIEWQLSKKEIEIIKTLH